MSRSLNIGLLTIISFVFIISSYAFAQTMDEIVSSMKSRNSIINQLKSSGIVGETSSGYLAFVGTQNAQAAIVEAENKDRKALYNLVAQDQGTSVQTIEKNMGVVKSKRLKSGQYYRASDGKWVKK